MRRSPIVPPTSAAGASSNYPSRLRPPAGQPSDRIVNRHCRHARSAKLAPRAEQMSKETLISISDIARGHGRHREAVHKTVKRLGLNVVKRVGPSTKGQQASHVAVQDYETHRQQFDAVAATGAAVSREQPDAVFYLILTEPELDPGRFKLGFSTDVAERLRSHKISAPFSKIMRTWPCKALWEKTAIDCIADGCERLGPEMFRGDDIERIIDRADRFFALMPALSPA